MVLPLLAGVARGAAADEPPVDRHIALRMRPAKPAAGGAIEKRRRACEHAAEIIIPPRAAAAAKRSARSRCKIRRSAEIAEGKPMRLLLLPPLALTVLSLSFRGRTRAGCPAGHRSRRGRQICRCSAGAGENGAGSAEEIPRRARAEDGNALALVLEEAGRPSRFLVVEKWQDVPAYKAHLGAPASTRFDTDLAAIRTGPRRRAREFGFPGAKMAAHYRRRRSSS